VSRSFHLDRRTLLRGTGALVALPFLEAMTAPRGFALGARAEAPRRLVFVYVPNGVHMQAWRPETAGADYVMPATLQPLEPFRDSLLVLSGLVHDKARANGDGPGDHARASASFLTGCQPKKTDGTSIKAGVSADQVAAARLGTATRLRSLEIGIEGGAQSGQCDSGYACAYSSNLSWATPHTPVPKETDPRLVFDRLFRDGDENETPEGRAARLKRRGSILDWVRDDARALEKQLGAADKRKLDEYTTAVRELERRVEASAAGTGSGVPDSARPASAPATYEEHVKLLSDLLVLALKTDTTRIATFSYANEGSNRSYAFLGVPDGHHDISHHGNDADKVKKIQLVNRFHVEQFAYLLAKLREAKEGDGDVLANSMIVYGSGISDGNRHNHDDLPILLAGRGGGRIASGRHVQFARETPAANLFVTLLEKLDIPLGRHGDSTGKLDGI
jgi:hypothetical protein